MKVKRLNNYKYMIIALHIVGLILCCIIAYYQIQLRRQLGYVVFWTTAISGVIQLLMRWEKYLTNVAAKLYGFCWILFSAIGLFFSVVTWQSAYCETDGYIMRESKGFMGWETAILYKKCGLQEIERHGYDLAYPEAITPIDSLGAVIIYGNLPNGEGGCEKDSVIYPMDDDKYFGNIDKVKEYAKQRHLEYVSFE